MAYRKIKTDRIIVLLYNFLNDLNQRFPKGPFSILRIGEAAYYQTC